MKTRPTIFLSGVSHEFGTFRDAVENEIEKKGCFAENQPGFAPDYRTVEAMLRRRIADSDAVVCLIGFRFGAEPNQRPPGVARRSYTQMEFDIAREMNKPIYLFLSADPSVRQPAAPDEAPEDAEATQLQIDHRAAVQKTNNLYYFFRDVRELCTLVAAIPPVAAAGLRVEINRIQRYAPKYLLGREAELRMLDDAWDRVQRVQAPRLHLFTIVALGGEGKTALAAHWLATLAGRGWPGCDAAFAWSFYSQGTRDQGTASADLFLAEALRFFGDAALADSPASGWDKGKRLAELVGEHRALLILDGLEPLQYAPTSPLRGELKDQGLVALLTGLAARNAGLCLVTTRYAVANLTAYRSTTAPEIPLQRLATAAGVQLLQTLGVRKESGTPQEFESLVKEVKGHALTLNLLGKYLADAHAGDIRRRDLIDFQEADDEEQGGHAFRVMDAYVHWFEHEGEKGKRAIALLRMLGLFDRPASSACLTALQQPPVIAGLTESLVGLSETQRNLALTRLEEANLLAVERDGTGTLLALDCHPLIREYFARKMQEVVEYDSQSLFRKFLAWLLLVRTLTAWQVAHRRLYEYLTTTTQEGDEPTLDQLQPLYQAVAHGCLAGLHATARAEVYRGRILKGAHDGGFYSTNKLGAFGADLGAVASFFDERWTRLAPALAPADQAWLFAVAAFGLRALGRPREALEPMWACLDAYVRGKNWIQAARCAINLSELSLTLGKVTAAVRDAEQAMDYADHSGDTYLRMRLRTALADALHQAGRTAEARDHFRSAETLQQEWLPAYPLLSSQQGFQYCDLLLADAERTAWYPTLGTPLRPDLVASLRDIEQRAIQTLKWWTTIFTNASLLTIALDHLTLARVTLYRGLLIGTALPHPADPHSAIAQTVDGLRLYGSQDHLLPGLLTRVWHRHATGDAAGARADLDEAWDIAVRGPMPLFQADILLHRGRLFRVRADLAAARALIEKHGYGRRLPELQDAEAAAATWG